MPTPASAHNTPLPTEKTRDCTAPPCCPDAESYAMIEKVPVAGSSSSVIAGSVREGLVAHEAPATSVTSAARAPTGILNMRYGLRDNEMGSSALRSSRIVDRP